MRIRLKTRAIRSAHNRPTPFRDAVLEVVKAHPGELTRNGVLVQLGCKISGPRNRTLRLMEEEGVIFLSPADDPRPKVYPGPASTRGKR